MSFPKVTNEQLATTKNKNILLKMYNKTTITQLGTCRVEVDHKNNKEKCRFFAVPGSGQALLGMPDTDVLNIIKINIHSIGAEQARGSDKVIRLCKHVHCVGGLSQNRKWSEVQSATQTWTAF